MENETNKNMTIKDLAIKLLSENFKKGKKYDYENVLKEIQTQFPKAQTSINCLRWYASKFKNEIQESITALEDADYDMLLDVAINFENDETELNNWEKAEKLVMDYEIKQGNNVKIAENQLKDGYDIKSIDKDGNIKYIEVKSQQNGKKGWLQLTANESSTFKEKKENYWLYVVEGDCTNDEKINIAIFGPDDLIPIEKMVVRFANLMGKERIQIDNLKNV